MGVFERPPGSGIYWINYHDETGKRKREKVGTSAKAAERLLVKRKEAIRQVKLFPEEHKAAQAALTVSELIDKYLPLLARKDSFSDDQRYARYCKDAFGPTLAKELKPSHIEAYRTRRLEQVKAATVNRCVAFLHRIYALAVDDELLSRNPVSKLGKLPEGKRTHEAWTPEEEQRILEACPRNQQRMLLLALLTGCRGGELFGYKDKRGNWVGLTWDQVDLARGVIHLRDTKNEDEREIFLSSEALQLMREQRQSTPERSNWVFPGRNPEQPMQRNSVYWALQRACDKAGVPRRRLHSTRHAFCSELLMAGVDLKTVSELAGHKTITVTAQLYGHVTAEHKSAAVERLVARRHQNRQAPRSKEEEVS